MDRIGRYELLGEIGRGSMGVVHLASDPQVKRRVALKVFVLPPGLEPQECEEFTERFLREAQAAGAVSHPGIVTIFDAGTDGATGVPFIAMEHIEGPSLRQVLIDQGKLPIEQVFRIGETIADALTTAHDAGVVHRDLKPANILLRLKDNAIKIVDFGVARVATSELTEAGDVFGSPAYMSPEQFQNAAVDGRSDLFSLAVILYQCLTGFRPFSGDDLAALSYTVVHTMPPPPSHFVPGLPATMDHFFERALAKDPDQRFQSGRAMRRGFVEAREGTIRAKSATAPKRAAAPVNQGVMTRAMDTMARAGASVLALGARVPGLAFLGKLNNTDQKDQGTTSDLQKRLKRRRSIETAFAATMGMLALLPVAWAVLSGGLSSHTPTPRPAVINPSDAALVEASLEPKPRLDEGSGLEADARPTVLEGSGHNGAVTPADSDDGKASTGDREDSSDERADAQGNAQKTGASPDPATSKWLQGGSSGQGTTKAGTTSSSGSKPVTTKTGSTGTKTGSTKSSGATALAKGSMATPTSGYSGSHPSAAAPATVATLLPPPAPPTAEIAPGWLALEGRSQVKSGKMILYVDGREVYSRALSTEKAVEDGTAHKSKLFRRREESFTTKISVPPGTHEVSVRVFPDGKEFGYEDSTVVRVGSSETRSLSLVTGRLIGPSVTLTAD